MFQVIQKKDKSFSLETSLLTGCNRHTKYLANKISYYPKPLRKKTRKQVATAQEGGLLLCQEVVEQRETSISQMFPIILKIFFFFFSSLGSCLVLQSFIVFERFYNVVQATFGCFFNLSVKVLEFGPS